jgi:hypothetical protein
MMGAGGPGNYYYDNDPDGTTLIQGLARQGFRVVQRAWDGTNGWFAGPGGLGAVACRYATLITWVHDQNNDGSAFCATGNSAGAGEIAYALTRYGRGDILDLAVPTGGPPFARLDYACHGDAQWPPTCESFLSTTSCQGSSSCFYPKSGKSMIDTAYAPATPCGQKTAENAVTLLADSVLSPAAVLSYPKTRVHFVFGADDCDAARSQGLAFHQAIATEKQLEVVAGASHGTYQSPEGAAAIQSVIASGCLRRH